MTQPEKTSSPTHSSGNAGVAAAKTIPPATAVKKRRVGTGIRRASLGDTTGAKTTAGVARRTIKVSTESAQSSQQNAVKDILTHAGDKADALRTLLAGSSDDDIAAVRQMLLGSQVNPNGVSDRPDDQLANDWRTGGYPYKNLMSRKRYESQKYKLPVELLELQSWAKETGQRVVILFEGRDAAGKGGTIRRFMEHLNPRGARVVALEKPSDAERGQWYLQRYLQHLPTAGEIVLFDRSW